MSALREVIAAVGPSLAPYARTDPGPDRFDGAIADPLRRFVLEAVYEGYLLHYGKPRAFAGMDEDLRLLAGDTLYALGLARLAAAGDLDAVSELADLISLTSQTWLAGQPELAEELWQASVGAMSDGGGPGARSVARDRLPPPR
ncbi:MAG: hypothetical protein ABR581_01465 [Thermoleophilaceae bacterium]